MTVPERPSAIVELRRYHLHPGTRETLIEVFDREFLESQEALGMQILGQFREVDDPDRFTWLRGFPDMIRRRDALAAFYGGPVWAEHGPVANPTMISSDDVLLLRPMSPDTALEAPSYRAAVGGTAEHNARYDVTTFSLAEPPDAGLRDALVRRVRGDDGTVALLETEPAENTFPALPVREGENVVVHVARRDEGELPADDPGGLQVLLAERLTTPPFRLHLSPTARSRLT